MSATPAAIARQEHAQRLAKLVSTNPCKTCGEPIFFVKTHHGKSLPFDVSTLEANAGGFIIDSHYRVSVTPNVAKHKCPEFTVYTKVADVLRDHPDLEDVWQELRRAPLARVYDPSRHALAKLAWNDALKAKRIQLKFLDSTFGFVSDAHSDTEWPIDSDGSPRAKSMLLPSPYASDGA